MSYKVGDLVFTPYAEGDYITPNKLYRVIAATKNTFKIKGDTIYKLVVFQRENHKSAHLNHEGTFYKLECSIQKRHNTKG